MEYCNAGRLMKEEGGGGKGEGRREKTSRTDFVSEGLRNLLNIREAMSVKTCDG